VDKECPAMKSNRVLAQCFALLIGRLLLEPGLRFDGHAKGEPK